MPKETYKHSQWQLDVKRRLCFAFSLNNEKKKKKQSLSIMKAISLWSLAQPLDHESFNYHSSKSIRLYL